MNLRGSGCNLNGILNNEKVRIVKRLKDGEKLNRLQICLQVGGVNCQSRTASGDVNPLFFCLPASTTTWHLQSCDGVISSTKRDFKNM